MGGGFTWFFARIRTDFDVMTNLLVPAAAKGVREREREKRIERQRKRVELKNSRVVAEGAYAPSFAARFASLRRFCMAVGRGGRLGRRDFGRSVGY